MTIEEKLKDYILAKYPSIREFTKQIEMPNSTFVSIMRRGINNSTIENIFQICDALDIDVEELHDGKIVEREHPTTDIKTEQLSKEEIETVNNYINLIVKARTK